MYHTLLPYFEYRRTRAYAVQAHYLPDVGADARTQCHCLITVATASNLVCVAQHNKSTTTPLPRGVCSVVHGCRSEARYGMQTVCRRVAVRVAMQCMHVLLEQPARMLDGGVRGAYSAQESNIYVHLRSFSHHPSPTIPSRPLCWLYAGCMLAVCTCVSNQSVPRDTTSLPFNAGGAECRLRRHTPHSGSLDSHMLASRCSTRSTLFLYHDSPI